MLGDIRRTTMIAPMRDGCALATDVWRGEGDAARPVILVRTPYGRRQSLWPAHIDLDLSLARGYTVVSQDVRGRGDSQGRWDPFVHEQDDGFDTVQWIAQQSWCNGRVVMTGMSYQGQAQWAAAAARPPALAAIAPVMSSRTWGEGALFTNGVREVGMMGTWIAANLAAPENRWMNDLPRSFTDREGLARIAPYSTEWFRQDSASDYWARDRAVLIDPAVPSMIIGGWYDILLRGTLRSWDMSTNPADRLIIGPWGHVASPSHLIGDRDLGYAGSVSALGLHDRMLDFFDDALNGASPRGPRALVYELEACRWVAHDSWPPPSELREYDLEPTTFSVGLDLPRFSGGRGLLIDMPLFGHGPTDEAARADRDDVAVLRVQAAAPASFAGPVRATLHVDPSERRRQWVGVLCAARPDGRLDALADAVTNQNARAEWVTLDLGDLAIRVEPDVDLVLLVSGGWFPRWEPLIVPGQRMIREGSRLTLSTLSSEE